MNTHLLAGRFRLDGALNSSGGVTTWDGTDLAYHCRVVVQTTDHRVLTTAQLQRFQLDSAILQAVDCPQFPRVMACGQTDSGIYVAVERPQGTILADRLQAGPLTVEETLQLGADVCRALHALHALETLHQDVQPANIVTHGGRAWLLDFGPVHRESAQYVSPEQAGLVHAEVGPAADLYSLGMVLFTCLAGHPPFEAATLSELLRLHLVQPLPPLPRDVPRGVEQLIRRLTVKEPRDRYQSAGGVLADLMQLIADPHAPIVLGSQDVRTTLAMPQFIGRDTELELLTRHLAEAGAGHPSIVLVSGASGVGKTRLLDEFDVIATREGFLVLRVQVDTESAVQALPVAKSMVRDLLRKAESAEIETVLAEVGPWRSHLLTLLPELGNPSGDGPPHSGDATHQSLMTFVHGLGHLRRGLVLLLDDLQWYSPEALVGFEAHSRATDRRVLIVGTYRTEAAETLQALIHAPKARHLSLAPLGREATARVLQSMAGTLSGEVHDLVYQGSDGNPFLSEEMLRGLVERGTLQHRDGQWISAPLDPDEVLTSQRGARLLAQRITPLGPAVLDTLSVAAVLGKSFDVEDLQAVCEGSAVMPHLEAARRAHIVWASSGSSWTFRHDRLREAVLEQLGEEPRRSLHQRVGSVLSDRDPNRYYDVAYHFAQGGRVDLAAPWALQAARHALRRQSYSVAADYYRIAAQGRGSVEAYVGLGDSLRFCGWHHEAEAAYQQAIGLSGPDRSQLIELHARRVLLADRGGRPHQLRQALSQALETIGLELPSRPPALALRVLSEAFVQLAHSWFPAIMGWRPLSEQERLERVVLRPALSLNVFGEKDVLTVLWAHLRGLNLEERGADARGLAMSYATHSAIMANFRGLQPRALRMATRACALAAECGDRTLLATCQRRLAYASWCVGRLSDALQLWTDSSSVLQNSSEHWESSGSRVLAACTLFYQGQLAEGTRLSRAVYHDAFLRQDPLPVASSLHTWALASLGRVPDTVLDGAEALIAAGTRAWLFYRLARGVVRYHQGRVQDAISEFETVWQPEYKLPGGVQVAAAPNWLSTLYRMLAEQTPLQDGGRRRQLYRTARRHAREGLDMAAVFPVYLSHALRENGLLAAVRGHRLRTRQLLDRSLLEARRHGMRHEEALTLQAWGTVGQDDGWEGAGDRLREGQDLQRDLEAHLRPVASSDGPSLSLLDRFDTLVEVGQTLTSSLSEEAVYQNVQTAGIRLLRAEHASVLAGHPPRVVAGPPDTVWSQPLLDEVTKTGAPQVWAEDAWAGVRSALCAPIAIGDDVVAWLYLTHSTVGGVFGEDESRLAAFVASLAGAALENVAALQSRLRALSALETSEKRFRTLFEGMDVAIVVVDRKGRIVACNPFVTEVLGYGEDDLVGQQDDVLMHENDAEQFSRLMAGDIHHYRLDTRCRRKSGELVWVQMAVSSLPTEGLAIRAISDISYQKLKQVTLFQETERRAVSVDLHDAISQPLVSVFYALQYWQMKPPEAAHLKDSVDHVRRLLLDLGQLMYNLRPPEVQEGLGAVLHQYVHEYVKVCPTDVSIELDDGLDQVTGLAGLFAYRIVQQCLTNVQRHARASRVVLQVRLVGTTLHGSVQDDGVGFDPVEVQARDSATRHFGLTGMRERAELLGGLLEVKSSPGRGTQVEFTLPITEP